MNEVFMNCLVEYEQKNGQVNWTVAEDFFEAGQKVGVKAERERIRKYLETKHYMSIENSGYVYSVPFDNLIGAINDALTDSQESDDDDSDLVDIVLERENDPNEKPIPFEAGQKAIFEQLREVARSGILPDGDHINLPTKMWLENLVEEKP